VAFRTAEVTVISEAVLLGWGQAVCSLSIFRARESDPRAAGDR
jgi:hypothetical protein